MSLDVIKQKIKARQFADAVADLTQLADSAEQVDQQERLYLLAVAQRYSKDHPAAIAAAKQLIQLAPDLGRAYQELGHCYREQGHIENARENYREAIRHNPALHATWTQLAKIEQQQGHAELAARDQEQARYLLSQPQPVLAAMNLLYEGKLYKAEKLCRSFLQKNPHHIEAMRTLANIGAKLNILSDAEFLLDSVLEFQPDYDLARFDFIKVLQQRQKFKRAHEEAEKLYQRAPNNPAYKALYANQCVSVDDFTTALQLYDELLQEPTSDHAGVYLAKGHLLKTLGKTDQAQLTYQRAYQLRKDFGDAYWSLANLKTYRFTAAEIAQMEAVLAQPVLQINDKIHLLFALGKAFEDEKEYSKSFAAYAEGNQLKAQTVSFRSERYEADVERQKEFFTTAKIAQIASEKPSAAQQPDPIFIVGLPRSGSTLIEQILASHSAVDGTMELPNILAFTRRLNGQQQDEPRYPQIIDELSAEKLTELGQQYIDETAFHRQGAAYFTDKMPNNFRHIGLIKSILPNATIIDARRHPLDCCFSCYKQLFAEGQEFTYSQQTIAHYYQQYIELMAHWKQVYPGQIHTVIHEQLIDNPEQEITRLLEFVGLPIESQCFEFHKSKRKVKTASSEQVRQPLNRSGMNRWEAYADNLTELQQGLAKSLAQWDKI